MHRGAQTELRMRSVFWGLGLGLRILPRYVFAGGNNIAGMG